MISVRQIQYNLSISYIITSFYLNYSRHGFCPTTTQNQSQINTVVSSQEKVDRVDGFEPTT